MVRPIAGVMRYQSERCHVTRVSASADLRINLRKITVNADTACGISTTDVLYCWGHDYAGAIGDGSGSDSAVPVQIMTDVADIADGGKNMNCAIKNNGSAFCWGNEGEGGSLGHGYAYTEDITRPSMVLSGEKWLKNVVTDAQILEKNMANNLSWTITSRCFRCCDFKTLSSCYR